MTVDQELTYEAVIELLAHQFAFPVKWIDTQDALLDQLGSERIVEVGPSNTLTVMAKRTVAAQFKDHDEARWIRRELLSSEQDAGQIHFETGQLEPPASDTLPSKAKNGNSAVAGETSPERPSLMAASESNRTVVNASPSSEPVAPIHSNKVVSKKPDVALTARAILNAMVAQKVKKAPSDLRDKDSIKFLAGGRSTLENELVGDIECEFAGIQIPDRAESLSLEDLAASIQSQSRFQGRLGKKSTTMIEKVVASKLPAGFGLNATRAHLDQRWGLTQGRQDAVLLHAVSTPPPARLADEHQARDFFDRIAREHLVAARLPVDDDGAASSGNSAPASVSIDPNALKVLTQEREAFDYATLQQYAKKLGVDLNGKAEAEIAAQEAISELQRQLDQWNNEHGEEYADGIKPIFDARKARFFESSWAWIIQDVLSVFYGVLNGQTPADTILRRISRNGDPKVRQMLSYLHSICRRSSDVSSKYESAEHILQALLDGILPENPSSDKASTSASLSSLQIKRMDHGSWQRDEEATQILRESQNSVLNSSLPLTERNVVLTGAGPGSIGAEVLKGLLEGGARVIVTTSRYSPATVAFFRDIYIGHGARGSRLVVVPFNQGSQQDLHALVSWIYNAKGLGWDIDAIIPFAALSESGREIDDIDSKSELAHRVMLTNTLRLIGAIKAQKQSVGLGHCPAQVILPLSANHGLLGGDGLYGESKIGLETLFKKWKSESWGDYLSIAGVGIGWTRGTGLMKDIDGLARVMEVELGLQTFSQADMATNILALLHPDLMEIMETYPIYADFNGGLDTADEVSNTFRRQRQLLSEKKEVEAAIAAEDALDTSNASPQDSRNNPDLIYPRANLQLQFPQLPDYSKDLKPLESLQGVVDLDSVVVIAGFSELGPWGNSRTRWEMESRGTFSMEGWVEMAWIMGYIKFAKPSTSQQPEAHIGWIDAKSGASVQDHEVEAKYGELILAHSGIRLVEPEIWGGYDPDRKEFFQEVVVEADLEPFDASEETAAAMEKRHRTHVECVNGKVYLKKGATIMVPKALKFGHNVNGQIPSGWDPRTYGISEQIISQVDRITLYSLICAVEALFSAGITDPYEIYRHIHTSELGNCLGTGVGGVSSAARMYKGRSMEQHDVPKDVLQETFLNTPAAWINMLLLSSNGPIRTPVGACATALESLDTAYDLIVAGKAKMCIVGGVDDLEEHMAYEFANMKATNNNELDAECGRDPKEMSRPTASDRRGFIESHGCGIQIVCTARLALEMGLPVYGIVAFSGTSADKVGRSVPAPGKGVMVNVRESKSAFPSPLLNLEYRRRQISLRRKQIQEAMDLELAHLADEIATMDASDPATKGYEAYRTQEIRRSSSRQEAEAIRAFGTDFWRQNPEIAPLRGALAAWGLTTDDLQVASFHGTSTVKNELNECDIMQRQLAHLGRTPGNRVLGVFQKHLTGHPKGAAGAWMLNGCLQIMDTGLVPGNRNADNIDPALEQFDHIAFLNRPVQTAGVNAASVFSFGFGQKGTQAVVVHPKYLFAALREAEYEEYCAKTRTRRRVADAEFRRRMVEGLMFVAKERPPFEGTEEAAALLDPMYRVLG